MRWLLQLFSYPILLGTERRKVLVVYQAKIEGKNLNTSFVKLGRKILSSDTIF